MMAGFYKRGSFGGSVSADRYFGGNILIPVGLLRYSIDCKSQVSPSQNGLMQDGPSAISIGKADFYSGMD
ncbi:hypothetical protein WG904_12800 [Pedobacter sp. Du54]|uniref:hypothetical protein n=1 Tax=Pedobacter anseongensis TaxID=3133439 RepID=UPI0030AD1009